MKMQRAGDECFDKFERAALEQVLSVPEGVQQAVASPMLEEQQELDSEIRALTVAVQQEAAKKRVLQRKHEWAARAERQWEMHRARVQQLQQLNPQQGARASLPVPQLSRRTAASAVADRVPLCAAMQNLLHGAQQLVHDLDQSSGMLTDSSGGAIQSAGSRHFGMLPMPAAATSLANTIKTVRSAPQPQPVARPMAVPGV